MNVLIVDDHEIVIRGLKDLLQNEFEELYVGEATTYQAIEAQLDGQPWDLILLDVVMPELNVIDVLGRIRGQYPEVPVLILTALSETEYAVRTIAAGANGYITKHYASDELILAVRKVLAGETYLSSEAAKALAAGLQTAGSISPHHALSRRELQVFCMIAQGKAVKEIAYDLSVSAKTVGTYVSRIKEKTGLENYVDIARYALQHDLVD